MKNFFQRILFVSVFVWSVFSVAQAADKNNASVATQASAVQTTRVNVNTATQQELAAIPGFSKNKAHAIVAYRKKNGALTSLDTLRQVSGFKRMDESTFKALQEKLSVG
ncbi:MAG: helix-hairpin-helix domain-containing protein [Gammaproteobacteria bacterium]|nr:helix-hairpin-helix domain-containing protein [Gammaproteobacteria bacterium]